VIDKLKLIGDSTGGFDSTSYVFSFGKNSAKLAARLGYFPHCRRCGVECKKSWVDYNGLQHWCVDCVEVEEWKKA